MNPNQTFILAPGTVSIMIVNICIAVFSFGCACRRVFDLICYIVASFPGSAQLSINGKLGGA